MKLGMNMLLWSTDVSGAEFDPVFELLKDAGFDGVEVPIFDREVEKYADLRVRLDRIGLDRAQVALVIALLAAAAFALALAGGAWQALRRPPPRARPTRSRCDRWTWRPCASSPSRG